MYAKLVSSGVSGGTGTVAALNNLRGVMAGTITSTSQLNANGHNQGLSYIGGTMPTTGIYTVNTTSTSTTYDGSGNFYFDKYHYAKGQSAGYTPFRRIYFYTDRDYSWRMNMYDSAGGNGVPLSNSSHFWGDYNSTTYRYGQIPGYQAQDPVTWKEMHLLMNDTTFAFQLITTGTDTQVDYGTYVFCDLEYSSTIDDYAYTGNTRYCPTIMGWWAWMNCMERADGLASAGANGAHHAIQNIQFMDQYGTYRNSERNDQGNEHYGYHAATHTNYPMLEPQCRNRVYQIPQANGNFVHQLVPVTYKGHMDDADNFGDPRRGRLMNWYRTSDSAGMSGDILTEGTTQYRIFRVHKTGDESMIDANINACYAFPEDNVPFGG